MDLRYKCLFFNGEKKNAAITYLISFAQGIIARTKNSEPVAGDDTSTTSASITRAPTADTEATRPNAACSEFDLWADLDDMRMAATSNKPTLLASDILCKKTRTVYRALLYVCLLFAVMENNKNQNPTLALVARAFLAISASQAKF